MELSRLLRRGLLVAAVATAGWLLSVVFAGAASADELPTDQTHSQKTQPGGLLGGLIGGLTGTLGGVTGKVTDITGSLVDTTGDLLSPPPPADPGSDPAPIVDLPALLSGSSSGSESTDPLRLDPPPAQTPATPAVAPPTPATIAPPVSSAPPARPTVAVPPAPVTPPATQNPGSPAEQAGENQREPEPVKSPTAPVGSGTTASSAHDNSGGAKGTHGVLPAQSTLHPADAGFTTRSRAVNAAGRAAGLPASSPD